MESKTLLAAFHIPVTQTILARSAHEAMMIATQMGFPVALKIDSPDITHKSDVGGVALNIMNGASARDTYTGLTPARVRDPSFGLLWESPPLDAYEGQARRACTPRRCTCRRSG